MTLQEIIEYHSLIRGHFYKLMMSEEASWMDLNFISDETAALREELE